MKKFTYELHQGAPTKRTAGGMSANLVAWRKTLPGILEFLGGKKPKHEPDDMKWTIVKRPRRPEDFGY